MQDSFAVAPGLALLFDMDGVLIESTAIHTRAWEEYLARHGIPSAGVMQKMLGKRNDEIVRVLWGPSLTEDEVFRHGAEKERLYRELMAPVFESLIVPGVREFIRAARRQGAPCALATNAEPANVDFVLDRTGLRESFLVIVDGHQVHRPKPDPEVYLTAAQRLGVEPRNCVIFEDSPGGLQAARAAGGRVVAVLTTLEEAPEADLSVRDFRDPNLLPWLSRQIPR
ncbi:MAG: HAD family hydrolase [Acidobacteriota bacterium]